MFHSDSADADRSLVIVSVDVNFGWAIAIAIDPKHKAAFGVASCTISLLPGGLSGNETTWECSFQ